MSTEQTAAQPTSNAAEPSLVTEVKVENVVPKVETAQPKEETPAEPVKLELKLPEGTKLDAKALEETMAYATANKLSQEQAQAILEQKSAVVAGFAEAQQKQLETLNDSTWKNELSQDAEVGGEKFEENGHLAHRAAAKWFGPEFADDLKAMKLNHHPKLFKGLVRIAKAMADDKMIFAGANAGEKKPMTEIFYGKSDV